MSPNRPHSFSFITDCGVAVVAQEILATVETEGMLDRPIFFHNMSDTGIARTYGMLELGQWPDKHAV